MKKLILVLTVVLIATVTMAQKKTQIFPKDLPKASTDYIMKKYPDFTIDKAYKVENKTVITYDVLISKPKDPKSAIGLIFDDQGTFMKKYDPNATPAPTPGPKTTTEPKK